MYHIDRGAWAEINLDAVAHNVQIAKSNLDPHTKLCAVVKADASCIAAGDYIIYSKVSSMGNAPYAVIYVLDRTIPY